MALDNKKLFLSLLCILFLCVNAYTQLSRDSVEFWVKEIKDEYEKVNQDTAKFKIVESDVFGQSEEGGFVKKYYDGIQLRKAVLTLYGETGQSTSEYYLRNNMIIFVLQKHLKYATPIYIGNTEIKNSERDQYYFH